MTETVRADEGIARQAILAWRKDPEELQRRMASLTAALEAQDGARARGAFEAVRELILKHLQEEEEQVFPLAEKALPEGSRPIRSLRIAHMSYREDLQQLSDQIQRGHLGAAKILHTSFVESFETHERLEDQLLDLLEKGD